MYTKRVPDLLLEKTVLGKNVRFLPNLHSRARVNSHSKGFNWNSRDC